MPTRRGRGRRGAAVLLAAVLGVLAAPAAATGSTASPTPGPGATPGTSEPSDPVRVEVGTLLPRAPTRPDEVLQVAGRLVNTGDAALQDLEVQLLVGDVVRSRSALALAAERPRDGRARGDAVEPARTELAPGSQVAFDVRVPVADLRLGSLGVYPLQVQVRGREGDARRGTVLGTARTFLPWFAGDSPAASRVAVLWPLVDEPLRTPDGALLGDALSDAVGGRDGSPGRLAALLRAAVDGSPGGCDEAVPPVEGAPPAEPADPAVDPAAPPVPCRGEPVPLTVAVDPALLEAVDALGEPHAVVTGDPAGDAVRDVDGDRAARRWLDDLRGLLAGEPADGDAPARPAADLLALPYADPDVVALTRQRAGLAGDVEQLRELGRRTAADLTGAEPVDSVAWPPGGRVTSAALDASLGGGATAVVLDEQALSDRPLTGRTPGTRTDLGSAVAGRVTGLVVEPELSELLAVTPDDPGWQGERLAEQRWLVETAIVAAERPGESRTFLLAPPRRGTVVPGVATEVLRDLGRLPWLCPVRLADVVEGEERCGPGVPDRPPRETSEDRGGLAGPLASAEPDAADELPAGYLRDVAEVRARGAQLTDEVLVAGSDAAAAVKARFLQARARAESSAWRERPRGGELMLERYADDVDRHRAAVQVRTSGRQLLTAESGVIEITVTNELEQPVTVGVQLNDPVEARLTSTDTDVRTVGPQEVVVVRLRAEARTSGQFVVRATLLDRAGQPFGEPAELVVTSTRFGRLALAVTGVGAGVLLFAAGFRIVRRAVRRTEPLDESALEDDA